MERVGTIVDEANRSVETAEKELYAASTTSQVAAAERRLADAVRRQKSLMESPQRPTLSAAALRAGVIEDEELNGIEMTNADLRGIELNSRHLRGANLAGSDLTGARIVYSDLRAASLDGCNLTRTSFHHTDLRGVSFRNASIVETDFQGAALEGADLRGATIRNADLRATYDGETQWPTGFNADQAGAVKVGEAAEPELECLAEVHPALQKQD